MTEAPLVPIFESLRERLAREHRERRARMAARAVHDDGIDLRRKRETKIELPPPEPEPEPQPEPEPEDPLLPLGSTTRIVQLLVAEEYGLTRRRLLAASRKPSVSWPRQVAMYLVKELTRQSWEWVGRRFCGEDHPNGRDHTTVVHAYHKVRNKIAASNELAARIEALTARIREACEAAQSACEPNLDPFDPVPMHQSSTGEEAHG